MNAGQVRRQRCFTLRLTVFYSVNQGAAEQQDLHGVSVTREFVSNNTSTLPVC